MKIMYACSASVLALLVAAPVCAQDAAPQTVPTETPVSVDEGNDIVVTATKRNETLRDVPISVAVTTQEQIERAQIRDLIDLQTLVPSLKVTQTQSAGDTNFSIRGFGNGAGNIGIEPSVGVFIDGVYRSRSAAQIGDLPNIQRVEVLRGPQSTLFGKNASAGIISIVTREPQFAFGGNIEASYGNYDAIVLKGDITGPLSDTIAVSLAGNYNKRDGYARVLNLNQDINDRDRYGVRGQILFSPSNALKLRLIADYDKIDENCCARNNLFNGPAAAAVRAVGGQVVLDAPLSYDSYANFLPISRVENYGASLQGDWNVSDDITLTSISAYRGVRSLKSLDADGTSADLTGNVPANNRIDTFTQELRLSSSFSGPLNFLVGGYLFSENLRTSAQLGVGRDFRPYANLLTGGAFLRLEPTLRALLPGTPAAPFGGEGQGYSYDFEQRNQSISIFGQADVRILEGLVFTSGLNYTQDRKRVTSNNVANDTFSNLDLVRAGVNAGVPAVAAATAANPFLALRPLQFTPPFLNFPNAVEDGRTLDRNLAYTLRLNYKLGRRLSVYASRATGYKPSSWNLTIDSRPFASDFIPGSPAQSPAPAASPIRAAGLALTNLTTGTRYAGPEEAGSYELGVKGTFKGFSFNFAVFDQTIEGFQANLFSGSGFILSNAEKQSTRGAEIDATFSPIPSLNFTASYTYLDPKYDRYTAGSQFNPATNMIVAADLSGRRPSGIPTHSIAVGGTYEQGVTDAVSLIYHVDYAMSSAYQIVDGLSYKAAPESLNASLTLGLAKGLEVSVWGRNLTDPRYVTYIIPSTLQSGSLSSYISQPRTYGGSVRLRF